MANYNIILDLLTNEIQLKQIPETGNNHLIWMQTAVPVINDQSFDAYETIASGQNVGTVICTDNNVTYEITSGNTGSKFIINSSTGVITTSDVLDVNTLSGYTLTVKVTSNMFPTLTDTAYMFITVLKIYTICANNIPTFSGTPVDNLVSYLTVGPVQVNTGTLGNYIIDWKLNSTTGSTVFISGNSGNTDPSIQAYHPFTREIVQSGALFAVTRSIEIDSIKYSANPHSSYGFYSPDLSLCLGYKYVLAMSCSGQTEGIYGYTITYTNAIMSSVTAERTMTYKLNSDGSSKHIGYKFSGYNIADRLTIYYVTGTTLEETVVDDWVVGFDCTGRTLTSLPSLYDTEFLKSIISLTGYTFHDGDYLKFQVRPSYNNPANTDTNWQLELKCFTDSSPLNLNLDPAFWTPDLSTINTGATINVTYTTGGTCTYNLNYTTISGATTTEINSQIGNLLNYGMFTYVNDTNWSTEKTASNTWFTGTTVSSPYFSSGVKQPLDGVLNINKTGNVLTYDFTNQNDYLHYKDYYGIRIATSTWTDYSSDPTNIRHYKHFIDSVIISMTSGDTFSNLLVIIDYTSTISFDDVNYKITTILSGSTNGMVSGITCDNRYDSVASQHITQVTYFNNLPDFSYDTIWGRTLPFNYNAFYDSVAHTLDNSPSTYIWFYNDGRIGNIVNFPSPWILQGSVWVFYKDYVRFRITNANDPANNFELYTLLNPDGTFAGYWNWRLIKKVGT